MNTCERLVLHYPPRFDPAAAAAFVARLSRRLRQADEDGLLPWGANAREDLMRGLAIGIKVAGSIQQLDAVNVLVDGEALGLQRYVLGLFPEAMAWLVAQDALTPPEFAGSRAQMAYALHPLQRAGLMPSLDTNDETGARKRFGLRVNVRGVGSLCMLPLCSRILTEEAEHG